MKKILFINPAYKGGVLWNVLRVPPLSLAVLAAHTPEGYEMRIIDENVERVTGKEDADIVAITSVTHSIPRAYEISSMFQERGVPVILGGLHPSMMKEESIKYCDAVVIGEGESVWKDVLEDIDKGRLSQFYFGKQLPLNDAPLPRRDLFKNKYKSHIVQTSRGCPFDCDFCSVTSFNGGKYRRRPVDDVIDDVSMIPSKMFLFGDDNIIGSGNQSKQYALKLFERLKPLNKIWGSQASLNIADDDEVLSKAAESGAIGFVLGIESVNEITLDNMNKRLNLKYGVKRYKNIIKKIHDYGITVTGAFVFGTDNETPKIFKETLDFIQASDIDKFQFRILTPLPGTRLYDKIKDENRMLYHDYPNDWKRFDTHNVVHEPKGMTAEELKEGVDWICKTTTTMGYLTKKAFNTYRHTKSTKISIMSAIYNRAYRINAIRN